MINIKTAKNLAILYNINLKIIGLKQWVTGLNIELEHRDITHENLLLTAEIAIAHLEEYPDYYKRLVKLEKNANNYWNKRQKPNIFL